MVRDLSFCKWAKGRFSREILHGFGGKSNIIFMLHTWLRTSYLRIFATNMMNLIMHSGSLFGRWTESRSHAWCTVLYHDGPFMMVLFPRSPYMMGGPNMWWVVPKYSLWHDGGSQTQRWSLTYSGWSQEMDSDMMQCLKTIPACLQMFGVVQVPDISGNPSVFPEIL